MPKPLPLIDTHAHLDFDRFEHDLEAVLDRAKQAGVGHIVTIGAGGGIASPSRAVSLARKYPFISATVGLHPHDADLFSEEVFTDIECLAISDEVVAIGETGLDYYYDLATKENQHRAFVAQIGLACQVGKPLVIHTRDAEEDTVSLLKGEGAEVCGGIIHCFSGSSWLAEQALEIGFYLSFSGLLTFPSAASIQEVAREVPLDRILVETDAPYLAPVPNRGKRNEPAYVNNTLRFLAEIRQMEPELLAQVTTENAKRIFRLADPGG
jgi:TatD DNase family protein